MARTREPPCNAVRDRILRSLVRDPGASLSEIAEAIDVHPSTAAYHVRVLEREERVTTLRVGRRRVAYPVGSVLCPVVRRVGPRLDRPIVSQAVATLVAAGHLAPSWLRRRGATEGEARWALEVLCRAGAAERRERGVVTVNEAHRGCLAGLVHGGGRIAGRLTPCARSGGRRREG